MSEELYKEEIKKLLEIYDTIRIDIEKSINEMLEYAKLFGKKDESLEFREAKDDHSSSQ